MLCKECFNKNFGHSGKSILISSNQECIKCKKIYDMLMCKCVTGISLYKEDILNWLYLNTPVISGDNLFIANSKKFEFPRHSEYIQISKIIHQLNVYENDYFTKDDKFKVFHQILGILYDQLQNEIKNNPWECIFALMSCLEINRLWALVAVKSVNNKIQPNQSPSDDLAKAIQDTYGFLKRFDNMMPVNIADLHSNLECLLANDRISIEHGIKLSILQIKKYNLHFEDIGYEKYINFGFILECLRSLSVIDNAKQMFTYGISKDAPLFFYSDGKIKDTIVYNNLSQNYIQDMASTKAFFDTSKYEPEINKILQTTVHFSLVTIRNILDKYCTAFIDSDEFLFGNFEIWYNMIRDWGNCSDYEAKQLFEYFSYKISDTDPYGNFSIKDNSVVRKPIIVINNIAISVANTFNIGLLSFYTNIFNGEIYDDILDKKLAKIYKQIDSEFETVVLNDIRKNIPAALVRKNITESCIPTRQTPNYDFPGEIDILLIYEKQVFVLECKNFSLKIDTKSMINDYNRLTKNSFKSIQEKLNRKVMWVNANLETIANYMNADNIKDYSVNGAIVCSNFSFSSQNKQIRYPVITWTRLCQWIQSFNNES